MIAIKLNLERGILKHLTFEVKIKTKRLPSN